MSERIECSHCDKAHRPRLLAKVTPDLSVQIKCPRCGGLHEEDVIGRFTDNNWRQFFGRLFETFSQFFK